MDTCARARYVFWKRFPPFSSISALCCSDNVAKRRFTLACQKVTPSNQSRPLLGLPARRSHTHTAAPRFPTPSLAMATMMTTRLVVRTGVACFGRRAVSNAFVARATQRRVVAIPGGARVAFAVRAVATDADAPTTTVGKVFKRHERIAAIKVRVVNPSGRGGSRPRRSHSQRGRRDL